MKKKQLFFVLFCLSCLCFSQSAGVKKLSEEVGKLNRLYKYEAATRLISDFVENKENSHYEKAHAYLLKSYIYKRLFDYEETLKCLDMAEEEGRKSNRSEEIHMLVTAEKSYAYFDTQQYEKAKSYMDELKANQYHHLKSEDIAFVIMQEGQLFMFDGEYAKAEKSFDEAILLMKKFDSSNLPVVYGKKLELYNKMGLSAQRDEAFRLGLASARDNKILKYQIYMHEVMAGQYEYNRDYKNAFFQNQIIDSLSQIYDAEEHSTKLKLYEKEMETQKKEYELETERKTRYFLAILSVVLLILFIISIKLGSTHRQKRILLEKESERMYNELQLLTQKLNEGETIEHKLAQYNLSERHQEIIRLIHQGKTNKEIANALFISENTVKYHLKTIYETLNIDNRNKLFSLLKS